MIDWTPVDPANLGGMTGVLEYKVENDGLVRWRGSPLLTSGAVWTSYVVIPPAALPLLGGSYGEFIWNTTHLYYPTSTVLPPGSPANFAGVVWQGTPPPANPHSLEGVQTGLADALRTIAGLRVYDFPSDRVEPPAAVLSLPETPYDVTLGGRSDELTFPLWVLVAKADDKAAYKEMIQYLEPEGTKSIRAVVEADRTLGGACDTVAVVNARPLFATVGGTEFLAVEFTLEVYT